MSSFKETLYNLKTFPSYFGRIIIPETRFAAKAYSGFVKLINQNEHKQRKKIAKEIKAPPADKKITKENGYLVFNANNDPLFNSAISHAQAEAKSMNWEELEKTSKKPFLINVPFNYNDPRHLPLLEFAISDTMLEPVKEYIGNLPVLSLISLWYSPNKENEHTRSRAYHLDGPHYRQVKCFIPIENVDEDTGPLCFIPAKESDDTYKKLRSDKTISSYCDRVTDEKIYAHIPSSKVIKATGDVGTICMVDTNTCYHYGSRKANKPRLLLVIQYLDPYCSTLPAWSRKSQNLENLKGTINFDRVESLLGLAHLEFRNAHPILVKSA